MDEPEVPAPRSPQDRVEGWLRTMLDESMLGPLLAVIVGHLVAFLVPLIVLAGRDRNLAALAAVSILLLGSASAWLRDWRRYRKPGPLGGTLLVVWTLASAASVAASHYGIC